MFALTALAMSIRYGASVVAWSADGRSALVQLDASGPEGGGSLSYSVMCKGGSVAVMLQSDFSPDGSSRPEKITEPVCRAELAKLERELKARGFDSVTVALDDCKRRTGMVNVGAGGRAAARSLKQSRRGETLIITEEGRVVLEANVAGTELAVISPNGRGAVIFGGGQIFGAWSRESGGAFVACK